MLSSDGSSEGLEGPSELGGEREIPAHGIRVATAAPEEKFLGKLWDLAVGG